MIVDPCPGCCSLQPTWFHSWDDHRGKHWWSWTDPEERWLSTLAWIISASRWILSDYAKWSTGWEKYATRDCSGSAVQQLLAEMMSKKRAWFPGRTLRIQLKGRFHPPTVITAQDWPTVCPGPGPVLLKLTLSHFGSCWTHTGHISWVISDTLTVTHPPGYCTCTATTQILNNSDLIAANRVRLSETLQ